MELKKYGERLVKFVSAYASGKMGRWDFEYGFAGQKVLYFPEFEKECPELAQKFSNTVIRAASSGAELPDTQFRAAIAAALEELLNYGE